MPQMATLLVHKTFETDYAVEGERKFVSAYNTSCFYGVNSSSNAGAAIKISNIDFIKQNELDCLSYFLDEYLTVEKMKQFSHENVLKMHFLGIDLDSKDIYEIVEYCDGGDVVDMMVNNNIKLFDLNDALELVHQICQGLIELNNHNIFNKIIKPDSIMISKNNGKPIYKIADFGFACKKDLEISPFKPFAFAAPEVYENKPSPKSDIWSLGVTLHYLIFGTLPFGSDNLANVQQRLKKGYIFPHGKHSNVNPGVQVLLEKMLCVNPDQRFSANDVLYFIGKDASWSPVDSQYGKLRARSGAEWDAFKKQILRSVTIDININHLQALKNGLGDFISQGTPSNGWWGKKNVTILSTQGCQPKERDEAFKFIRQLNSFSSLKIAFAGNKQNLTNNEFEDIGNQLKQSTATCQSLELNFEGGASNCKDSGIHSITQAVGNMRHINNLSLVFCDGKHEISDQGFQTIGANLRNLSTLSEGLMLDFRGGFNKCKDPGLNSIIYCFPKMTTLQSLKLLFSGHEISDEGFISLGESLNHTKGLELLWLNFSGGKNNCKNSGFIKIAQAIGRMSKLEELRLWFHDGFNEVGDDAMAELGKQLQFCTKISKTLWLAFNGGLNSCKDNGLKSISKAILSLSKITDLGLWFYEGKHHITDDSFFDLGKCIKNSQGNYTTLALNFSGGNNMCKTPGFVNIAEGIGKMADLIDLGLGFINGKHEIGDAGFQALGRSLQNCVKINREIELCFSGGKNLIDSGGVLQIAKAFESFSRIQRVNIVFNRGKFDSKFQTMLEERVYALQDGGNVVSIDWLSGNQAKSNTLMFN